ncbi:uncharacterized protein BDZ83DRAFT_390568 [Colletotrichum acutatum]|uniref:Uncharacterized protein n=1 Tax=Glomerella acutata TaxID=27357 RepID=A0AAD8XDP0_GLOAC|nr:uncharacterized protein BDZ83DRAFT_390568 [Colletotrichum acutatum]KAK1723327.1 hypothetical protein BDZ83DRAFT_390568 [Colletotrichum acutatum]
MSQSFKMTELPNKGLKINVGKSELCRNCFAHCAKSGHSTKTSESPFHCVLLDDAIVCG